MPSSPEQRPETDRARAPVRTDLVAYLTIVGPGLAIAATGVGAGDMVAAAVSGSRFGIAIAWAAIVGALLKYVLNEALARWQLATGTTLLEGWVEHLGRWIQYVFMSYLVVWSFVVAGALISACGLAAHALVPALSVTAWGALHSVVAAAVVLIGSYGLFERLIKVFIGLMFVTLIGCALFVDSPVATLTATVVEAAVPAGSTVAILGVIGGVGGSVTLLLYGYWIREKGWEGTGWMRMVRVDLAVAYVLTGLFGLAVVVLATHSLYQTGEEIAGSDGVIKMASMLEQVIGVTGRWTFLLGFWGAVATSLLGVWQGVPYLFADFAGLMKQGPGENRSARVDVRSNWYRGYVVWLALPPLSLLYFGRPVLLIVIYAVMGAMFMPFLAATLLYLNSRREWIGGGFRNGWLATTLMVLCLVLFSYLGVRQLIDAFGKV